MVLTFTTSAIFAIALAAQQSEPVSFAREVLPILSDRCFTCHGPDAAARDSDLRLDMRASVFGDLGGYAAVVPGDLEESELIARIVSEYPADLMPPPDSNLSLSADEINIFKRWVAEGARWEEHWSFVAPTEAELPPVSDLSWPRGLIDLYVQAAHDERALQPNADAAPHEWLRRVTLDLTGLPPTPEEYATFGSQPSEADYLAVVERLLASPRYGERMSWEWLDAARYADTDGFQADPTREMWPWRDWLVAQLNANTPFDQLTREMLAGDLLPNATPEQILASGFNRNHMTNGEGGRIFEETRVENVFDRVETTATVFMGLTMGCARCHDHKYDPISQKEYFQLSDFFNQTSDTGRGSQGKSTPNMLYEPPSVRARLAAIALSAEQIERARREASVTLDAKQSSWEADLLSKLGSDPSWGTPVQWGPWHRSPVYVGTAAEMFDRVYPPEETALSSGEELWQLEPGLKDGEVFRVKVGIETHYFARTVVAPSARTVSLSLGSDDAIAVFLDGESVFGRNVGRGVGPDQDFLDLELSAGEHELVFKIVNTGGPGGIYFRQRNELTEGFPLTTIAILQTASKDRTSEEHAELLTAFRSRDSPAWKEAQLEIDALQMEAQQLRDTLPTVLVMDTVGMGQRRATRLLERGGYDQPRGDSLNAATPAFLPALVSAEERPLNRLDLANWLLDPEHPLTARVTVNREWARFFGRGLVPTPEDFGRQGDAPSHPELLDFLASSFIADGWDLKQLHRRMVLSSTYRQSSTAAVESYMDDPENIWLTRTSRPRLPSWMLRDQALALAGLLVEKVGGPPVRPYQPDGVWAEATFNTITYQADSGESLYRRSLYVFWRRIVKPTFFFDTAKRQACEVRRSLTNTPLHALVTQNDPAYVEAARFFAERAWRAADADATHSIAWAWHAATGRKPLSGELQILEARWRQAVADYRLNPEDAQALLSVGEAARDAELPAPELAALTLVTSIILNLDEVLCKS